ncbi:phospholipase A2 [Deinococcus aquaedulcis]|uniref:phospholipase A2 n=1 Tax=Deinococcus aquaedulcis TaxID=2840455 RepID=UPI001C83994E|nr:phospholipase A2 [Deinococcus aquaedulcis]
MSDLSAVSHLTAQTTPLRRALGALSLALALAACGGTTPPETAVPASTPAQPTTTAVSAVQPQFIVPEDPSCDPYAIECPQDPGGGGTSYYRYWTLAQVATIDARAAYAVNLTRGSAAALDQERAQHYPAQKALVDQTPTDWTAVQTQATPYAGLNWSQDGCSTTTLTNILTLGMTALYSQTFGPACRLHDFAYRNIARLANEAQVASGQVDRVDHVALRREVDDLFLNNMLDICVGKAWIVRGSCNNWAKTFASAVRSYGGSSWAVWNFTWEE